VVAQRLVGLIKLQAAPIIRIILDLTLPSQRRQFDVTMVNNQTVPASDRVGSTKEAGGSSKIGSRRRKRNRKLAASKALQEQSQPQQEQKVPSQKQHQQPAKQQQGPVKDKSQNRGTTKTDASSTTTSTSAGPAKTAESDLASEPQGPSGRNIIYLTNRAKLAAQAELLAAAVPFRLPYAST